MSQIKNKEQLTIDVLMDDNLIPESIEWKSSQENKPSQTASAALIYFWNAKKSETFNLDLWTKEMMVDEMKYFHFQTLMTLADSLDQSTKENVVAEKIRKFGMQIGKEMDILTK